MPTREELAVQIDVAKWEWLRAHSGSGALVMIDRMLDLAEVGAALAADDAAAVQRWMASGLIAKPDDGQMLTWDQAPEKPFNMLIVSPFVLMQDLN
jgi:hypothetical protein